MTLIRFRCPHCRDSATVPRAPEAILRCPTCGKLSRLPRPQQVAAYEEDEIEDVIEVPETAPPPVRRIARREDSWDEEPPRPRRRRRRPRPRREPSESSWPLDFVSPYLVVLLGLGLIGLVLVPVSFVLPPAGAVCMVIGLFANLAGAIWILMLAARDGEVILVLLIPFYSLFYILKNLEEAGRPALLQVVGTFLIFGGGIGLGVGSSSRHDRRLEADRPATVALAPSPQPHLVDPPSGQRS